MDYKHPALYSVNPPASLASITITLPRHVLVFEARQDASSNALSMVLSQIVRLLPQEVLMSLGHSLQRLVLFIPDFIRKAVTFSA